ncbi:LPS-assembly protein LptD [Endothiovibrio diazotrophicus]
MKRHFPSPLPVAGLISAILGGPALAAPGPGQWACESAADGGWACFQVTGSGRVPVNVTPVPKPLSTPAAVAPGAVPAEPAAAAGEGAARAAVPSEQPAEEAPPESTPRPGAGPQATPEPQPIHYPKPRRAAEPERAPAARPVAPRMEPEPTPAPERRPRAERAVPDAGRRDYSPGGAAMAERYWESGNRWALCGDPAPAAEIPAAELDARRREEPMRAEADGADIHLKGTSTFSGGVTLDRADQHLDADQVDYDKPAAVAVAEGNVVYRQQGFEIDRAATGRVEMDADRAEFTEMAYRLPRQHARGEAATAQMEAGGDRAHLEGLSYTTCPDGNGDWLLTAEQMDLDYPSNEGVAHHAKLRFKGVPLLASPWLSFPLDERRKSGLLAPKIGASDATGFDVAVPYYFNLAPNYDATLTPRLMSDRGAQLAAELRYLQPDYHGTLDVELLPDDDQTGDTRGLVSLDHVGTPLPNVYTEAVFNYVSDDAYLNDFGGSLARSSTTHLERYVYAAYFGGYWNLAGRLQDYQTVDPAITAWGKPYRKLPQVTFEGEWPWQQGLRFGVNAEYVNFDREVGVTGSRVDVQPRVSLDWGGPGYYVTPSLSYRHTAYNLDNVAAGSPDSPDRGLPIVSVDGGLFFERDTAIGGRSLVQTLEPRLYYLYVKDQDQSQLPLFDTAIYDFSFSQLFRENRFGGSDRVGDANQLTLALSSRYLDGTSGRELFRASAGQILYFDDRNVTLPGMAVESDDTSDFVAEAESRLWPDWLVRGTWLWDVQDEDTDKGVVQLRYNPGKRRILNLAYRYRRNLMEQTDVSLFWPVTPNWAAIARWNYDLRGDRGLETLAGFEYQSCCWAWRMVGRSYVNDDSGESNSGIYLQLELKGLGRLGSGLESVLERGILGYGTN